MALSSDLYISTYVRVLLNKALKICLTDKLSKEQIREKKREIWKEFHDRTNKMEKGPTFGASFMTRLAVLTHAIYNQVDSLVESEAEQRKLTTAIIWEIYWRVSMPYWRITRLISKGPIKRLHYAMNFYIKCFPYRKPGYNMEILTDETKIGESFAFNVYHCPPAAYFKKHGLSQLCLDSWCN